MLRELKLSNFRHFDDEITVRFRPITILIGENNAGKSSVIKFLLMLKQSLVREEQFLVPFSTDVKLSYSNMRNRRTKKTNAFLFSFSRPKTIS